MTESGESTISVAASDSSKPGRNGRASSQTAKVSSRKSSNKRLPQIFSTSIAVAILVVAGWGAWSFFSSSSAVDDGESIADVSGFDSAPPFLSEPSGEQTANAHLGDSGSLGLPEATDSMSSNSSFANVPSTDASSDSADVWLTGTIEEEEPTERIPLPKQLSGGPNESLILR